MEVLYQVHLNVILNVNIVYCHIMDVDKMEVLFIWILIPIQYSTKHYLQIIMHCRMVDALQLMVIQILYFMEMI